MADSNGRTKWGDLRLDDRFTAIDRQIELAKSLPADVRAMAAALDALREDVGDAKAASQAVMRVLLGFFSALLIVLVAAIVGVIVAL